MRYNKNDEPILRRLTVNSPFRLVYETFCVLSIEYEWKKGAYPYAIKIHTGEMMNEFYERINTATFEEFDELIEYVNGIMEERGYIKPIERI